MDLASLSLSTVLPLVAALAVAGAAAGFLSGIFGIGGGSVLVPALYMAFGAIGVPENVRMQLTLGTSFAVILPTGLRSYLAQRARGAVDIAALRRLAPFVFVGVMVGVLIASRASSEALRWVWVVAAALMALKLALGRDDWKIADTLKPSYAVEAAAFAIGVLSALMSIGGGLFMVSLLMLYGYPVLNAVATSSGFGPLIAATGLAGYVWAGWGLEALPPTSIGYVNVLAAALVIPTSVLLAPLGVRVAHGLSKRSLELAFAAFLGLVSLKFLWTLVG